MKNSAVKVKNSSKYWFDYESEKCVYYYIEWSTGTIDEFKENFQTFLSAYIELTNKFGIAINVNAADTVPYISELRDNSFNNLYLVENKFICPSLLFTDVNNTTPDKIVSVDPLLAIDDINNDQPGYGSIPFRIELVNKNNSYELMCFIDNDLFLQEIDNPKTKQDPEIGEEGCWVDNYELALLNTSRLNSFLRDLFTLCKLFGATSFDFEDLFGGGEFTETGIEINNEIIVYEDIYDTLPEKYRL
jgi:hypothetical protein